MAVLAAAAPYIAAAGAVYGGYTAYQSGKAQEAQSAADAAATAANGRLEAERIRKQAKAQKSAAMAALAQNGVDVGEGSALVINDQITQDSEQDAWMSILGGQRNAARINADGKAAALRGRNALTGSLISAAGTAGEGYAKANPKTDTQPTGTPFANTSRQGYRTPQATALDSIYKNRGSGWKK